MEKAIADFKAIRTAEDLKRNKLTLSDYHELHHSLQSLVDIGTATTAIKTVADWLKRHNFKIFEESECYDISK